MGVPLIGGISDLLSRSLLAIRAGVQYGGKRDLYTTFGYNPVPTHGDFLAKYLRQDIAKRVNDAPVDATWSDPPEVDGGSAFNTTWQTLAKDNQLFHYLAKTDSFAGLGTCAVLVIGFDDNRQLNQPVSKKVGRKINYLQPYLEGSIQITQFEEDQTSPRFGQPVMYEITPGEVITSRISATTRIMLRNKFQVHYSRILHVADNTMENTVFGHSRLEVVYNLLDDLLKVVGGSAETYWLTSNRGMQVDVDKEMDMNQEDAENLSAEIEEYMHQLRRFIRTRGVKINNLGTDVADPRGTFDVLMSLLSAATKIPKRVLMGAEAGQLASQQDRANWAVTISERISNYAEPTILRPLIQTLVNAGVLPEPQNLSIAWPDAYKMSPLERAQTSAQMARSMVNATKALQVAREDVGTTVFTPEEVRRVVGFGKHMPIFEGKPEGKKLPKQGEGDLDPDPSPTTPNPNPQNPTQTLPNQPSGTSGGDEG